MTNDEIKTALLNHARELDRKGFGLFQVRAFRAAAIIIQGLPRPVEELLAAQGRRGLEAVPGIGKSIAYAIDALIRTGELKALRSPDQPPREQVRSVAGVGHRMAERLKDDLGVDSVSDLREADLSPLTPHQRETINADLERVTEPDEPEIADLLFVDELFRQAGEMGPITRNGWVFRVRPCASALAFRMEKTRDWVEVRFSRPGREGMRLVVSEGGARMVRGREERRVA